MRSGSAVFPAEAAAPGCAACAISDPASSDPAPATAATAVPATVMKSRRVFFMRRILTPNLIRRRVYEFSRRPAEPDRETGYVRERGAAALGQVASMRHGCTALIANLLPRQSACVARFVDRRVQLARVEAQHPGRRPFGDRPNRKATRQVPNEGLWRAIEPSQHLQDAISFGQRLHFEGPDRR